MMKKQLLFSFFLSFASFCFSQTATFITLDDNSNLYRVTVNGASSCTNTSLNICNFTNQLLSIALDGNKLYIVDNKGNLYKTTLGTNGTVGACTKVGTFPTTTSPINGMTVGNGGIVYGAVGSKIESYNPTTNKFATVGSMPSKWTIGGDLLFYKGVLYEAVKINGSATDCALIEINLTNVGNSTLYMNFNTGTNAFGFASVTVPCSNNQAYALSNGTTTTKIYAIDMVAKTEATTATCTLNYNVYDAASIAETQTALPPNDPVVTSPINYCVGQAVTPITVSVTVPDTLRWYKLVVGGSSYGSPTPAVSTSSAATTNYYVSNFDTSTGCESDRVLVQVIVNPYPNVPTINPSGTKTICATDSILLSSSAIANNQWFFNGNPLAGATNKTYYATNSGNYTVSVTGAGGCSKTSVATTVTVTNATINYTGNPYCNTGTATVVQTGETGGNYTSSPTGLNINATTGEINLAASSIGTYTITYTVGVANCKFTTSVQVVSATASISYLSTPYCKSSVVQNVNFALGSTTGGSFSAMPSGLSINTTTGAITPSLSTVNNYTVTYTYGVAGVGCGVQTATTTVTIVDTTKSTTPISICSGSSYVFNGSNYVAAGTYIYNTKNAAGCDSIATLVLTINPKLTSTTPVSICNGDSTLFNGTYYKTAGTYNYNTTNAKGCDSIATLLLSIKAPSASSLSKTICNGDSVLFNGSYYKIAGIYNTKLTNAVGCDSMAALILTLKNFKINLSASPNPVNANTNLLAQITATATIASSVWQPSTLFINNIATQTVKAPNNDFVVKVTATSINGCVDSASKPITVIVENDLVYIPNSFVPTDAINTENKTFKVYGNYIKNATMDIYNQLGEKIKSLNDVTNIGWNGTAFGKQQPSGVYTYSAKIVFQNNKIIYKKGIVNLVR
jgi:gliding motility-associated-like protein